jgi:NhaP-type Na+/H+ or K+/H+ antiporter
MGTVSPAILVPAMVDLQHKRYGVDKSIPTICIAASSFNDILAITVFRIFQELAFDEAGSDSELDIHEFLIHVFV